MENFCLSIQKSLTDLTFAVGKLYDILTVERCASAMKVAVKTAYGYKTDQIIPTERLLNLMTFSRDTCDPLAREQGRRIAAIFAEAAGHKVVSSGLIDHVNQLAAAINDGGEIRELGKGCPLCGGELALRGYHDNEPVYGCKQCRGVGLRGN